MAGLSFRYTSLGVDRDTQRLAQHGLTLVGHHADAWENDVYTAVRERPPQSVP